ncbi:TIR domain-containing protein [Enterobacter hormaechei]|uniref:TIR domain-containing protein n=1 Tax=Enterobacter hormaechei TaxID=158836 RepID=UPI0023B858E1|nr:TIR domain-containing protein [Enterobacter hormaechei]
MVFLIGKLTRNRVAALVKGNVETPNDISGVVYISIDESERWKAELTQEMRVVGYNI